MEEARRPWNRCSLEISFSSDVRGSEDLLDSREAAGELVPRLLDARTKKLRQH
jgi:hypothetical protein